jgi:hypothetical protein
MSSPAQGGPSVPVDKDEKKKGLGKMIARVKTVLRRPKRMSMAGPSTAVAPEPVVLRYYFNYLAHHVV